MNTNSVASAGGPPNILPGQILFLILASAFAAIICSACSFNRDAIKTYNKFAAQGPYDVIIVPGIPYDGAKTGILFKARMYWAKELFDRGIARNIIFSGAAVHSPYVEGQAMKIIADSLGIPPQHTFIENRAEHSTENVRYGLKMAHNMGFKTIAVATDAFQNEYLAVFVRRQMNGIAQLPLSLDSMHVYKRALPKVDAREAYVADFTPIEQR